MKRVFLLLSLGSLFIADLFISSSVQVAMASSTNSVQFHGEISAHTCRVNINGHSGESVVVLPTVSVNRVLRTGYAAGETPFSVNITGCEATMKDSPIKVLFSTVDPTANGNLRNRFNPNGSIAIQIMDSNGTPLSFSSGNAVTRALQVNKNSANGTLTERLIARYYAENDGATTGLVLASAQFEITYD